MVIRGRHRINVANDQFRQTVDILGRHLLPATSGFQFRSNGRRHDLRPDSLLPLLAQSNRYTYPVLRRIVEHLKLHQRKSWQFVATFGGIRVLVCHLEAVPA